MSPRHSMMYRVILLLIVLPSLLSSVAIAKKDKKDKKDKKNKKNEKQEKAIVAPPTRFPTTELPSVTPVFNPTNAPFTLSPTSLRPTASPSTSQPPSLQPSTRAPSDCSVNAKIKCTAGITPCEDYVPSMQCSSKPHYITFRFVNGVCNGANRQGGTVRCRSSFGGTMGQKRVRLSVIGTNNNFLYFTKEVEENETFSIRGFPRGRVPVAAGLKIFITKAGDDPLALQYVTFDATCSSQEKSFSIGDRFGSVVIESFGSPQQGSVPQVELKYTYEIENEGSSAVALGGVSTTRHGTTEDLGQRYYWKYAVTDRTTVEPNRMVSVFRKETVDLRVPGSYSTSFHADVEDEASGMTCSDDSSFTFTVRD